MHSVWGPSSFRSLINFVSQPAICHWFIFLFLFFLFIKKMFIVWTNCFLLSVFLHAHFHLWFKNRTRFVEHCFKRIYCGYLQTFYFISMVSLSNFSLFFHSILKAKLRQWCVRLFTDWAHDRTGHVCHR